MKFYCLDCKKEYEAIDLIQKVNSSGDVSYMIWCECSGKIVSCSFLVQKSIIPLHVNCDTCTNRFKCFTNSHLGVT
jgi:hypothetical protein